MNILKFFYPKDSLKRAILNIKEDIKKDVSEVCSKTIRIDSFGAYEIDPKNLVFFVCVKSDQMKMKLKEDKILNEKSRELFIKYKYPKNAIEYVSINFESQETVDRDYEGNWYYYYK
ncbi:hypothetical protein HZP67_17000 [Elizabethkingia anophelis]|nr:hypothetical protein [Elizabethkingia anophelis]MCT4149538.1 hypothetical protein [Elizabethkingia anophelis]